MPEEKQKKSLLSSLYLILGITVLALFLRVYNIFSIPVFADEAIYIRWAQVMKAESTLRFLPLSDGKQPFFMWSVIPFLKVFSDPLVAGRAVSVVSGLASMAGVFFIADRLFGRRAALVAALLYALSPMAIFFDRIGLVDSMLSMFGIWVLFFAIIMVQTLRLDFAMLAGFALGGALLTKSPAMFFLGLMPTTVFLARFPQKKKFFHLVKLFSLWIVSFLIGLGLYNILRLGPNFHMLGIRNQDYVFGISEVFKHPFDPFKAHLVEISNWLSALLPWTVLVAAAIGFVAWRKRYWREFLVLGAWILVPLFAEAEIAKVFTTRYILFTIPPLFIIGGLGIASLYEAKKRLYFSLIVVLMLIPIYFDYLLLVKPEVAPLPRVMRSGYLEEWTSGTGIREAAQYIKKEHKKYPNQYVVVGTEGYFGTLPDGLQMYLSDISGITVKGVGISISSIDDSLIAAKRAENKVFLVVNSTRLNVQPADIGLVLLASYPKAVRPDGNRESLLLFEVSKTALTIHDLKNPKSH